MIGMLAGSVKGASGCLFAVGCAIACGSEPPPNLTARRSGAMLSVGIRGNATLTDESTLTRPTMPGNHLE